MIGYPCKNIQTHLFWSDPLMLLGTEGKGGEGKETPLPLFVRHTQVFAKYIFVYEKGNVNFIKREFQTKQSY